MHNIFCLKESQASELISMIKKDRQTHKTVSEDYNTQIYLLIQRGYTYIYIDEYHEHVGLNADRLIINGTIIFESVG